MLKNLLQFTRKSFFAVLFFAIASALTYLYIRITTRVMPGQNAPLKAYTPPVPVKRKASGQTIIEVKNATFRLTPRIVLQVPYLKGEIFPKKGAEVVNFDDIHSFAIDVYEGTVEIPTSTVEIIFNEIIMNFPGAPLRKQKIRIIHDNGRPMILVTGEMKLMGAWIPYEMRGVNRLDPKTNLIIMEAESIKSLGNPMTKQLMGFFGLNLEKLLKIPEGRGLTVRGNQIIIHPFMIMPPPQTGGYVESVSLKGGKFHIRFRSKYQLRATSPPLPQAPNYVYLSGGELKFGRLFMVDADLQMIDMDPKDPFDFYAKDYKESLSKGYSKILPDGRVLAYLPDYRK